MHRFIVSLIVSVFIYFSVLSIAHSFYLTKINKAMEKTIQNLVNQISEIQGEDAWYRLNKGDLK